MRPGVAAHIRRYCHQTLFRCCWPMAVFSAYQSIHRAGSGLVGTSEPFTRSSTVSKSPGYPLGHSRSLRTNADWVWRSAAGFSSSCTAGDLQSAAGNSAKTEHSPCIWAMVPCIAADGLVGIEAKNWANVVTWSFNPERSNLSSVSLILNSRTAGELLHSPWRPRITQVGYAVVRASEESSFLVPTTD